MGQAPALPHVYRGVVPKYPIGSPPDGSQYGVFRGAQIPGSPKLGVCLYILTRARKKEKVTFATFDSRAQFPITTPKMTFWRPFWTLFDPLLDPFGPSFGTLNPSLPQREELGLGTKR